jgi:hypothetical protein
MAHTPKNSLAPVKQPTSPRSSQSKTIAQQLDLRLETCTVQIKTKVPPSQVEQIDRLATLLDITRSQFLRNCLQWFLVKRIPRSLIHTLDQQAYRERMDVYGQLLSIRQSLETIAQNQNCPNAALLTQTQVTVEQVAKLLAGLTSQ